MNALPSISKISICPYLKSMFKNISFCILIYSIFFISFAQAQGIVRAIEAAEAASKASKVTKAVEVASKTAKVTEGVEVTSKALKTLEVAKKFIWASQKFTRQISEMEIFCFMDKENLTLFSNYIPAGFESTIYIRTGNHDIPDAKTLVKYLTYGDGYKLPNEQFDKAFQNSINIKIDPSVYQDLSYRNIDWVGNQHLNVFDGKHSYKIISFKNSGGKLEPLAKIEKNVYIRIIPEEFCRTADYGNALRNFISFFNNAKEIGLETDDIKTNINDASIQQAANKITLGGFISNLASSGLTLVNYTCSGEEKIERLVFGVYKEPSGEDIFLKATDKLGEIEIDLKNQKQDDKGWGIGWYILIGFIALCIIGSFVKDE